MAGFYARMATTARRLIDRYGQEVEIRRDPDCPVDPITQEEDCTGLEPERFYPRGILRPYSEELVDDSTILRTDRLLILDDTVEPRLDDAPRLDGEAWTVVNVTAVSPAGTPLVYRVQVRR